MSSSAMWTAAHSGACPIRTLQDAHKTGKISTRCHVIDSNLFCLESGTLCVGRSALCVVHSALCACAVAGNSSLAAAQRLRSGSFTAALQQPCRVRDLYFWVRASRYFHVRRLDGTKLSASISCRNLRLIEKRRSLFNLNQNHGGRQCRHCFGLALSSCGSLP